MCPVNVPAAWFYFLIPFLMTKYIIFKTAALITTKKVKKWEGRDLLQKKIKRKIPENQIIFCMWEYANYGPRVSARIFLHFSSTRVTQKLHFSCRNFMQYEYLSLLLYTCINLSYVTENMRKVLVQAIIVRILNSRKHWQQPRSSGLLGCMQSHCCKIQPWRTHLSDTWWRGNSFLGTDGENGLQKERGCLQGT